LSICIYCGASGEKEKICKVCGNELSDAEPGVGPFPDEFLVSTIDPPDISAIDLVYEFKEGFSRANWKPVFKQVRDKFTQEEWHEVWCELCKKWLHQLKDDLGGSYRIYESHRFFLLSAEASRPARKILGYAEDALARIETELGATAQGRKYGKKVILAFSEEDDYYSYVAHFYPDGEHNASGGMFIGSSYGHIAFPLHFVHSAKRILIHELTHNCLWGVPIPLWLEEGIAQRAEDLLLNRGFSVDMDLAEQHRAFWNDERIQEFWSGLSWKRTGDSSKLSYSLAEVLVHLLSEKGEMFGDFVAHANYRDGGQTAALDFCDCCLGELVGGFLGKGDWRPQRKAIADHFEQRKKAREGGG
jgi:hypothetical protein